MHKQVCLIQEELKKTFPATAGYTRIDDGKSFTIWQDSILLINFLKNSFQIRSNFPLLSEQKKLFLEQIKGDFPNITLIPYNENVPVTKILRGDIKRNLARQR